MFRIKICGVTRPEDAAAASGAGADAVGLNFYERSPRVVAIDRARAIAREASGSALRIGVFVNANAERILQTVGAVGLDAVQLHGDEPAGLLAELPTGLRVIKAMRIDPRGLGPLQSFLADCRASGRKPDAFLLDAASSKGYGGTGEQIDWSVGPEVRALLGETPWILAGGLKPSNVTRAIGRASPDGVDTASGVETSPGVKDHEQVRLFVRAAEQGFPAGA